MNIGDWEPERLRLLLEIIREQRRLEEVHNAERRRQMELELAYVNLLTPKTTQPIPMDPTILHNFPPPPIHFPAPSLPPFIPFNPVGSQPPPLPPAQEYKIPELDEEWLEKFLQMTEQTNTEASGLNPFVMNPLATTTATPTFSEQLQPFQVDMDRIFPVDTSSVELSPNPSTPSTPTLVHKPPPPEECKLTFLPPVNLAKNSISQTSWCARCKSCIGILIFYGTSAEDRLEPIPHEFLCYECEKSKRESCGEEPLSKEPRLKLGLAQMLQSKKKKRTRGDDSGDVTKVHRCQACDRVFGVGGVLANSRNEKRKEAPESKVGMEAICVECVHAFDVCTQCGGGNLRTGKWRPRQLFLPTKKTCRLPHDRKGFVKDFKVSIFVCPVDETSQFDPEQAVIYSDPYLASFDDTAGGAEGMRLLERHRDEYLQVVYGRNLRYFGTAEMMALHSESIGTWNQLLGRLQYMSINISKIFCGGADTKQEQSLQRPLENKLRRYMLVAHAANTETTPKGRKSKASAGKADPNKDPSIVWTWLGYLVYEWNFEKRLVGLVAEWYPEKDSALETSRDGTRTSTSTATKASGPLETMVFTIMQRILTDVDRFRVPKPELSWARVKRQDIPRRPKELLEFEAIGFVPIEKFGNSDAERAQLELDCRGCLEPYEGHEAFALYVIEWIRLEQIFLSN
ncbi:hypothetical protein HDU97_007227 [Phlyctochytrium planicorne]|nr:hypothetical protein HDU97_007227 [Phlyctochytrium planicorne]